MTVVRPERAADRAAVRDVHQQAFGRVDEADLVDALRDAGRATVSLVALHDGRVVGHVLFSPIRIEDGERRWKGLGLAPLAVLPALQRQGIGTRLARAGLTACRVDAHDVVVVLGHPEYYLRFGFDPACTHGLRCTWDVPDEVFMVLSLQGSDLEGICGTVHYAPEFEGL